LERDSEKYLKYESTKQPQTDTCATLKMKVSIDIFWMASSEPTPLKLFVTLKYKKSPMRCIVSFGETGANPLQD
jgi:hypothetical protein